MGTKIYNSDLTREIQDVTRLATAIDPTPTEITDKVIPVIDVNPKHARVTTLIHFANSTTSAAAVTIMNPEPNNDVYITALHLGLAKNVLCSCGNNTMSMTMTINGINKSIGNLGFMDLIEDNINVIISLADPIKIDRNTAITFTMPTFAAGAARGTVTVYGYRINNIRA